LLRLSTVVDDSSPDYVVEDPPVAPFGLAFETDERERLARFDTVRESLDRGRRILVGFETVAIMRFELRLVPRGVVCLFVAKPRIWRACWRSFVSVTVPVTRRCPVEAGEKISPTWIGPRGLQRGRS